MDHGGLEHRQTAIRLAHQVLDFRAAEDDPLRAGVCQGAKRVAGIQCRVVQLDWVYNSMPPTPRQIYPEGVVEAVTEF